MAADWATRFPRLFVENCCWNDEKRQNRPRQEQPLPPSKSEILLHRSALKSPIMCRYRPAAYLPLPVSALGTTKPFRVPRIHGQHCTAVHGKRKCPAFEAWGERTGSLSRGRKMVEKVATGRLNFRAFRGCWLEWERWARDSGKRFHGPAESPANPGGTIPPKERLDEDCRQSLLNANRSRYRRRWFFFRRLYPRNKWYGCG